MTQWAVTHGSSDTAISTDTVTADQFVEEGAYTMFTIGDEVPLAVPTHLVLSIKSMP